MSPPSINVVRTSSEYVSALLTINEFNGDYFNGPGTYTANLTGTNASSFILSDSTLLGPTIAFDPTGQTNPQGYSCYVNITITGTTVVVPITLELDIPAPSLSVNENLGSWLSPIQKNNGVIGFSYDIIANKRYLTIGFGTGADGSLEITNGTAKTGNYALVTNLDYDADSRVAESDGKFPVVIYAAETDSGSGSFFKDYAVWIRSSDAATAQSEPRGIDVSRTFKFTVPTTGDYVLTSSIDYSASVIIDDAEVFTGSNSYGSTEETTVALDQGSHTITWILTGDRLGPTGVALQLKRSSDNLEIWNTRYTTRNTTPYLNWAEIYRIPIKANGTAQTLLSSDYLVKSWQFLGGLRYGQYFKDDNILSVVDDGTGDLTITFNPDLSLTNTTSDPTITSASELFYYYSTKSVRVENLSSAEGDGTQTRWFRGFTKDGVVKTSLQNYPGSPTGSSGSNTNIPINNGNQNQEQ